MSRSCTPKAGSAGARVLVALWVLFAAGAVAVTSEPTSTGVLGRAPDAESLQFEPTSVYGVESKDVKLTYQFNDPDGDEESGSLFSWATADATGALIDLGSAASVPNVPEAAINQPLTACVTPKTDGIRTAPSTGKQACITTTVQPPSPLVKDVVVKVKEADGLFLDTNNLSATYTWEGVGNDTSIYAYGPTGQSAALLQTGGGNTNAGTIPDFSLAGYAGKKLELSIKPQSHYGGVGSTVTTSIDGYVYNPNLPPLAEFLPVQGVYNSATKTYTPPKYLFDRAGGAAGDRSWYRFYIGNSLVREGEVVNGEIPQQSVPDGVYGFISMTLKPRNGALIEGKEVRTSLQMAIIDPNSKPVAEDVRITSSAGFVVGATLSGTYRHIHDSFLPGASKIAWREFRSDSQAEKRSYLDAYGVTAYLNHSTTVNLPTFVVPGNLYGKAVELLVRPCSQNSTCADGVESGISPVIGGVAPVVSDLAARPSIDASSVQFQPSSYLYTPIYRLGLRYLFSPNGGDFYDNSQSRFVLTNIVTGGKRSTGWRNTNNGLIDMPCYPSESVQVEILPKNGLGIVGDSISVALSDLGLGPEGLGYCYDMNRLPTAADRPVVAFVSADNLLYPGGVISATYNTSYQTLPGMGVFMEYSWAGQPYKEVVSVGAIPSYVISDKDVGKPISLSLRMREADSTRAYINRPTVYTYTTDGFLSGIVLEP